MNINATAPMTSLEPDPPRYSISDLAREFKVTTRTIRHYEDSALLNPQREGQSRIFNARDRVRLNLIVRGKRLGFSLKEIKEMLDLYDAPQGEVGQLQHFIEKMRVRREELLCQRIDINQVIEELENLEARCAEILGKRTHPDKT